MAKRLRKLRRESERRRRQIHSGVSHTTKTQPVMSNWSNDDREGPEFYYQSYQEEKKPSFGRKDFILMRSLVAVCLFLVIAILFKTNTAQFEDVRVFVTKTYEEEFQFASIANLYEEQFGRPLALVPVNRHTAQGDPNEEVDMVYALPANGVIHENFEKNGQGILIETNLGAEIEAVRGGYVISIGENKEAGLGKTVVVQHYDGAESVYGKLMDIKVNVYDHIQAGDDIGTVSENEESGKGIFYFALKENNHYIDPSEVLSFD